MLHGLGPDHLAAISTYAAASGSRRRSIVLFAVRFAAGHAAVLALLAALGQFALLLLPPAWERGFELAAAGLLVVCGAGLIAGVLSGRLVLHHHSHDHGAGKHGHAHLRQSERHQHVHGTLAAGLGALFALGGVRSLAAVVPIAAAGKSALSIAAFALGIVLAMVAFAALTGSFFNGWAKAPEHDVRTAHGRMRLACLASGAFAMLAGAAVLASVLEA